MENEAETGNNINFTPCVKWVKRNVARSNPLNVQLSKNELVEIIKNTKEKLGIAENQERSEAGDDPMVSSASADDEFNFAEYDKDDSNETAQALGIHSLAELPDNVEAEDHFSESDDSEKEDDLIKPNDNLILVAHVEGDASLLEVYVYNNEDEESFYVHHDILLPSFPLCLEWLNYEKGHPSGNYCAVGCMSPVIDVWDVDVINCLEPAFKLGRVASVKKKRTAIGHTDAVLALAWNDKFEHVMASGSVDQKILLWDMETQIPSTTITAFQEKVQCLQWHRLEGQTLLAGGCDETVKVFDCRTPEICKSWNVDGEAERVLWDPLNPYQFFVATSKGVLQLFDCRVDTPKFTLNAHEKELTGLVVSDKIPGLLITASADESVKVWDYAHGNENNEALPELVNTEDFKMGNMHCLDLNPDSAYVIAIGGDNKSKNFTVFDLQNFDAVRHRFHSRGLIQTQQQDESVNNIIES